MVATPERPALTHNLDVDVCVVGAGLAGLTVAREAARRGWSVTVLEADRVAGGASGRNGGFVSPGFAEGIDAIVDRVGLPRAKELWALSEAGVEYMRRAIAETAMPGVEPRDGRLSVRRTDDEAALIEHVAMLRVEFNAEAEAWPADQVREVLRSPQYFQGVHFPKAFHIHPLNYALGLAADAEKHGARIFEGTPATGLDPAGVRKRVQTPHGVVRARHVVLAGSVGIAAVDAQLAGTVLPISTYVAVTAPLGEKLFEAVRYTGAVADTRRACDYYRVVADDRLLWGGRISTRTSAPRRLQARMRRDILSVYPQLGDIEITHAWSGTMAYAVHKMPQIGELAPGYWLASAFGGHGLNTTAMAGEIIARAIFDGDDRWRLFSPYELVWAGGGFGRTAARTMFWSMQVRDAVQERVARYRDRARREADARHTRWEAENAARKAAVEARRAEAAAKRIADQEARRLAAEEARRVAAEKARLAKEEVQRAKEEGERQRREAERMREEARLAEEAATRQAAEQVVRDAGAAFARQLEEHKALTMAPADSSAPPQEEALIGVADTPPKNQKASKKRGRKARKKKEVPSEPVPPST
jgi:glycine/D-amino acid oxidase-like deaminating enzyme